MGKIKINGTFESGIIANMDDFMLTLYIFEHMIDISESPTSVFDPPVFLAPHSHRSRQLLAMEDEDEEWPQRWVVDSLEDSCNHGKNVRKLWKIMGK